MKADRREHRNEESWLGLRKSQRERVDFQVSVLTALIVIISCSLIFFLNYFFTYRSIIGDLQERAVNIHNYLEERLDSRTFFVLNTRQDSNTRLYQSAKSRLETVRSAAGLRYLYTAKRAEDGELIYLVDGLPMESEDFRYIADPIEEECIPDLKRALSGETVLPSRIKNTTWGPVFISYFPMHQGAEVIGAIGLEFDAGSQYRTFRDVSFLTAAVIAAFCLLSGMIAAKLFRRISNPSYRDLANTDFLTGLKNRNSFEVDIHNLDRTQDRQSFTLISIDLDRLKQTNDTYGHAAGDEYIRLCAETIREKIPEAKGVYRIGGDEFSVVVQDLESGRLERYLEEIREAVAEADRQSEYHMGLSVGYASFDAGVDESLLDTLRRADQQMYQDKREKRS